MGSEQKCLRFLQQRLRSLNVLVKLFFQTLWYLIHHFHIAVSELVDQCRKYGSSELLEARQAGKNVDGSLFYVRHSRCQQLGGASDQLAVEVLNVMLKVKPNQVAPFDVWVFLVRLDVFLHWVQERF